jgi:hypothetical protein
MEMNEFQCPERPLVSAITSLGAQFVGSCEKIEKRTCAPGLGIARIWAKLSILVRQFRKACPRIILDVAASGKKDAIEIM